MPPPWRTNGHVRAAVSEVFWSGCDCPLLGWLRRAWCVREECGPHLGAQGEPQAWNAMEEEHVNQARLKRWSKIEEFADCPVPHGLLFLHQFLRTRAPTHGRPLFPPFLGMQSSPFEGFSRFDLEEPKRGRDMSGRHGT